MVAVVRQAALNGRQAAAWPLERRRSKLYALRREKPPSPMTEEQARAKYRELTGHEWEVDAETLESLAADLRRRNEGSP